MKTLFSFVFLLGLGAQIYGQNSVVPDTLIAQDFQVDPSDEMLPFPSGNDVSWVNYNQDGGPTTCAENFGQTPGDWYWESDLGTNDPTENSAFTSCSFRFSPPIQNQNWLITPPIFITDNTYSLSWKSLTLQGPFFVDGYKVLISNSSNDIESFDDTLFRASQMLTFNQHPDSIGSLNLANYTFSPGYLHADNFSDTNYFFIDSLDVAGDLKPYYHGRLEPHCVSLAGYANQTVYIAFLHDSFDDFTLQIDDIAVTNAPCVVSASNPPAALMQYLVQPNPARDFCTVTWALQPPQPARLEILDAAGIVVWQQDFQAPPARLDLSGQAAGAYFLRLQTSDGQATRLLIKF